MMNRLIAIPTLVLTLSFSQFAFAEHEGPFASCMDGVYKKLDLTPEQTNKIKAIKDQVVTGMKDKELQMKALHNQLKDLVRADAMDQSKLDALVNQKKELIGEMMKNKIMTRFEIYHLLTAKQKETFTSSVDMCEQKMISAMEGADTAG